MELPDDKHLERALKLAEINDWSVEDIKRLNRYFLGRSIIAHARTLQEQDAQGEPVAVACYNIKLGERELEWHNHLCQGRLTDADRKNGWTETPLYAAPPTKPQRVWSFDDHAIGQRGSNSLKTRDLKRPVSMRQRNWYKLASEICTLLNSTKPQQQPQDWLTEAREALEAIRDAWVSNNSEGDDYDEGYDDGLKHCHDIARITLREAGHG